jgi:hypothetical protein
MKSTLKINYKHMKNFKMAFESIFFAKHFVFYLICALFILISCEKVIDIDLNSAAPKIVIEAEISDSFPCVVKISQTVNFNNSNIFPAISGATVTISDDMGTSETLVETTKGMYTDSSLHGISGRTYKLSVIVEGKEFTAISKMPDPVKIDTAFIKTYGVYQGITYKYIISRVSDPASVKNYYRFIEIFNGVRQNAIYNITEDYLQDGQTIELSLWTDDWELQYLPGDSINILLQSIDKGVYKYFSTLLQYGSGYSSSSPANPISNISNGSLGYFSAYAVKSMLVIVP